MDSPKIVKCAATCKNYVGLRIDSQAQICNNDIKTFRLFCESAVKD